MKVINKSARIIGYEGVILIPMEEAELPKEAANHPRIKKLIKDEELEVVKETKPKKEDDVKKEEDKKE
ncbi:hypothetical protein [Anaerosolibacter sp.]|uniref:hypothetical protein n=1 Tax=Anaerosolibacter sp. TaxID=1872527 RepID=UPI0039EE000D